MIKSLFGEVLSATEFLTRCGWSEHKMHVAVRRSIVFSVVIEGQDYYPAFLADRRYNVRQIARIIRLFQALPNGSKFQFFVTRKGSLGGMTPLEGLLAGRSAQVMNCARAFLER